MNIFMVIKGHSRSGAVALRLIVYTTVLGSIPTRGN